MDFQKGGILEKGVDPSYQLCALVAQDSILDETFSCEKGNVISGEILYRDEEGNRKCRRCYVDGFNENFLLPLKFAVRLDTLSTPWYSIFCHTIIILNNNIHC